MPVPTLQQFDQRLAQTRRLFQAIGIDPDHLAEDFVPCWICQGKSPAEIVAIATCRPTLRRES